MEKEELTPEEKRIRSAEILARLSNNLRPELSEGEKKLVADAMENRSGGDRQR